MPQPAQTDFVYDVFISYSSRDGEWVRKWLLPRLEAAGLKVCIDYRDFEIGKPSLVNMERAVEQSRKTLLVLTPNWVQSEWTTFEALLVQTADPAGLHGRILPLRLEPCELPKRIAMLTWADFTSPDRHEIELQRIVASFGKPVVASPPSQPPNFAHPYPLQPNFTGRARERTMLTKWLTGGPQPVLALIAIGGMGKSALTWAWLQRDVLGFPLPGLSPEATEVATTCRVPEGARPEGVLWWSFYERESRFAAFLNEALTYASGGSVNPADVPSTHDKVRALITLLQQHRLLLVLDGFERELRAYASLSAAYQGDAVTEDAQGDHRACADPHAADFLRRVASLPLQSRVLLTSRLFPRELDELAGCQREDLTALDAEDAVTFFHAQGVRGTRAEIQDAGRPYGYHPLALRLLAGVIVRDKRTPGDVRVAHRYPVLPDLKGKEQHHILLVAYDLLDEKKRTLLSRIAAFRNPMTYDALTIFNPYKTEKEFDAALDELSERGLLFFDRAQARFDLHPVVRQHAYDRLTDKAGVHTRLRDYFAAVPAPDKEKVQSVDDLTPIIELYYHTVHVGRYDEAWILLYDRLADPLQHRFGAYQIRIELLRALFPNGEDCLPQLSDNRARGWTLDALASSYSALGQPRRAMCICALAIEMAEKYESKLSLAMSLCNIAHDYIELGKLSAAEQNLRRSIDLCREFGDKFHENVPRLQLGRLLIYQGAFDESAKELDTALLPFSDLEVLQHTCHIWCYRTRRSLLMGDARTALANARRTWEMAGKVTGEFHSHEHDTIETEWLIGAALVALASEEKSRQNEFLTEAESHLTEALTRCRRINMVDHEPDILLAWARWHRIKGNVEQAKQHAEEALTIADRCSYRLMQADVHNFLAQLALDAGDRATARHHAQTAHERATCDGPPHCYKPALDEAERLLREAME